MNLPLSSSDCEFLTQFAASGSLAQMCSALRMDKGYASRRIAKIGALAPVLARIQGKWVLTPQGQNIVAWYREACENQKTILEGKTELVFGTTQTISERKLTALTPRILSETNFERVKIRSEYGNPEAALFSRAIDFALVCAIPQSPEVRFKRLFKASYVVVIPQGWKDEFATVDELLRRPYVCHSSIDVRSLLNREEEIPYPAAEFDHLVGVRQGVIAGLGWAILPSYAIEREIDEKKLKLVRHQPNVPTSEVFYLWWLPANQEKKVIQQVSAVLSGELN